MNRITLAALAVVTLPAALPLAAAAQESGIQSLRYTCDRGAVVWASYINAGDSFAVVAFEGRQLGFRTATSASGARYVSTDPAQPFVWWTKGETAMMLYGTGDDEAMIYDSCTATPAG